VAGTERWGRGERQNTLKKAKKGAAQPLLNVLVINISLVDVHFLVKNAEQSTCNDTIAILQTNECNDNNI